MYKNQIQKFLAPIIAGIFALTSVLFSSYSNLLAATTTPTTINYQGRLLNSGSTPLSGSYTFRFSLWNTADWVAGDTTGAGAINTGSAGYTNWQEAHTVTTGTFGLFNISLGSITTLPNFDANTHKFLQVEVKTKLKSKMAKKRERLDVIRDILKAIRENRNIKPTRLLYASNLSCFQGQSPLIFTLSEKFFMKAASTL